MRGPANYKVVQNEKKNVKVPRKLPWAPEPEVDATLTPAGFTPSLGYTAPCQAQGTGDTKVGL